MLPRTRHKRRPQPGIPRRLQIKLMRRHHHHLIMRQPQQIRRPLIHLRIALVPLEQLRRQDAIPRQPAPLRHIRQQRHIPVGQRGDNIPPLQPRQPPSRIRPRIKPMPRLIELRRLILAQPLYPELRQQLVQDHPVQRIDIRPRQIPAADALHRRPIPAAPPIRETRPIHPLQPLRLRQPLTLPYDAAAPIHHRPEHIKSKRLHLRNIHSQASFKTYAKP